MIHTVGPVWSGGGAGEPSLLAACYRNSLALARDHGLRTIAFPAISTGAYRFPLERATRIAVRETRRFLEANELPVVVTFVCFDAAACEQYATALAGLPGADG